MTEKFKELMKIHGITYADIANVIDRTPSTVKQRISSEHTFHNHIDEYMSALESVVSKKDLEKKLKLKEFKERHNV